MVKIFQLVTGIILMGFLFGLIWFFGVSPYLSTTKLSNETLSIKETDHSTQIKGPKELYFDYFEEVQKSTTLKEYTNIIEKYGSKKKIGRINYEKLNEWSDEFQNALFITMKGVLPSSLQLSDIQQKIVDNTATLTIEIKEEPLRGSITMLKEGKTWKIDKEVWK